MNTQILVNAQVHESRIAILEDGKLVELIVERPDQRRMVGNIYKGKVERVLPGIQAAFIDIGTEKRAFLHVSDVAGYDPYADAEFEDDETGGKRHRKRFVPDIRKEVKTGEEILVQITKEPMGTKGPRCSTELSLPGRYLVYIPGQSHFGVSRKIKSRKERGRIRSIIKKIKPEDAGLIGRSACEGKSEDDLRRDLEYLIKDSQDIKKKAEVLDTPVLLYRDQGMIAAMVRDLFTSDMKEFILDSQPEYDKIREYSKKTVPNLVDRIKLYKNNTPIFDAFDVETQISNMLKRKIWIKKGSSIVIDNTEALTAIDVNSGKNIGKGKSYEDTLLQVNLAAAEEIARQLRLRDLGGIIAIDFIDMELEENRKKLQNTFEEAMAEDRARFKILPINDFGMIMMTRQRVRQSVIERISDPCPTCGGIGMVFSPVTVIAKLERWLMRASAEAKKKRFLVITHPLVAGELTAEGNERMHELENFYHVRLECFPDPTVDPDEFFVLDADSGESLTDEFAS
jgi:ribonuclease G